MYQPLSSVVGARDRINRLEANSAPNFENVVEMTLRHGLEEESLKEEIKSFSAIGNETSRSVRDQHEEHPYPHWIHMPRVMPVDLRSRFPHYGPPDFLAQPKTILVAGCGTGKHAAGVAMQWPNTDVLAIDLSTASIA